MDYRKQFAIYRAWSNVGEEMEALRRDYGSGTAGALEA